MIIKVRSGRDDGPLTLVEPQDMTRLECHVVGLTASASEVGDVLLAQGAGTRDGDHAWLRTDWLRHHVVSHDASLSGGFDDMIAFAASNGWCSPTRDAVRAHIVWETP